MVLTFLANLATVFALAYTLKISNSSGVACGLCLGSIIAFGIALTSIAHNYIWLSKSCKLFLIDAGYPVVGIIIASKILSYWQ